MVSTKHRASKLIASLLLVSVLVLSQLATTQRVEAFAGGNGTAGNPYQISNATELASLSSYLGGGYSSTHFVLTNDINLDVSPYNTGSGWTPIGNNSSQFIGKFDGGGHTISGLYINRPGSSRTGLFGYVANAGVVENVTLSNVNVTGGDYTGGLIGYYTSTSTVDNAHVSGTVTSNGGNGGIGGVVGWCHTSTGPVTYSSSSASINGTNRAGSLVGYAYCPIANSYSTGDVVCSTQTATWCGGLVGINAGAITNSYATGSVTGPSNSGRLGGLSSGNFSTIDSSYSTGLVSAPSGTNIGGLVGTGGTGVTNSFWDSQTSGQSTSAAGTSKTTAEMNDVATFTDTATSGLSSAWDFVSNPNNDSANNDYWAISSSFNDGYPYLSWQDTTSPPSVTTDALNNLSTNSAELAGTLGSAGTSPVTRRGFVWGTDSHSAPGSVAPESSGYTTVWDDDDFALGSFSTNISSLTAGTTYYYRAFALSADGTTYGNEQSFQVLEQPDLISPVADSHSNGFDVDLNIHSAVQAGTLQLILTGDQTITLTLDNLSTGLHSFSIDPANPTSSSEVVSSSSATIPDGQYDITLQYTDSGGYMTLSDSVNDVYLDTTVPVADSLSPANNATGVGITDNLSIGFNEPVSLDSGNVVIHDGDNNTVETIPIDDSRVSGGSTNTISINPNSDLEYGKQYYITVDVGAISDLAGNDYAGITTDSVWRFTTEDNPDMDTDGVQNSIENSAPNSGDANNDGTLDSQQSNVVSLVNPNSNQYMTLALSSGCSITSISISPESSNTEQDDSYAYQNGLVNFTANCGSPGFESTVNIYYFGVNKENLIVRKYNANTNTYSTISTAMLTEQIISGKLATVATYSITDGGNLDQDGLSNGVIVDPVGLGQITQIQAQEIGSSGGGLVDTGQKLITYWIISSLFVVTPILVFYLSRSKHSNKMFN